MTPAEITTLLALPPRAHKAIRRWAAEHKAPGWWLNVHGKLIPDANGYLPGPSGIENDPRLWCPCDTADLMGIAAKLADSDLWWMERTWDAVRCFAGHPPGTVTGDTPRLAALRLIGAVCG